MNPLTTQTGRGGGLEGALKASIFLYFPRYFAIRFYAYRRSPPSRGRPPGYSGVFRSRALSTATSTRGVARLRVCGSATTRESLRAIAPVSSRRHVVDAAHDQLTAPLSACRRPTLQRCCCIQPATRRPCRERRERRDSARQPAAQSSILEQ